MDEDDLQFYYNKKRMEPTTLEKYPEGRRRLFALAENNHSSSSSNNKFNQNHQQLHNNPPITVENGKNSTNFSQKILKLSDKSPNNFNNHKPKMGLKDIRRYSARSGNNIDNKRPLSESYCSSRGGVDSQEQSQTQQHSFQDKLTNALKGLKPSTNRNRGGAVAADDVIYYPIDLSQKTNNSPRSSKNLHNLSADHSQNLNSTNSAENLSIFNRLSISDIDQAQQQTKVNSSKINSSKVNSSSSSRQFVLTNYKSGQVDLDDLRKMYKSSPDFSTATIGPSDDDVIQAVDQSRDDDVVVVRSRDDQSENDDDVIIKIDKFRRHQSLLIDDAHSQATNVRSSLSEDSQFVVDNSYRVNRPPHSTGTCCCSSYCSRNGSSDQCPSNDHYKHSSDHHLNNSDHHLKNSDHRDNVVEEDAVVILRQSSGSPTDSGYRSVPREMLASDYNSSSNNSSISDNRKKPATMIINDISSNNNNNSKGYNDIPSNGKCTVLINSVPNQNQPLPPLSPPMMKKQHHRSSSSNHFSYNDSNSNSNNKSFNDILHQQQQRTPKSSRSKSRHCYYDELQDESTNHVTPPDRSRLGRSRDLDQSNLVKMTSGHSLAVDNCPKLVKLDPKRLPWSENDFVKVIQKGRSKATSNQIISPDIVGHLMNLMQIPLVRLAKEMQRLSSQRFNRCTKHEAHCAAKIILPFSIGQSCAKAAVQATALYNMSCECIRQSKSRQSGLRLNVGRFHKWICDAQIAACVNCSAAVYLTAVLENLLEELILQAVAQARAASDSATAVLTCELLTLSLNDNAELWGLFQPYAHLISCRTACGSLRLPFNLEGSINNRDRDVQGQGLQQQKSHVTDNESGSSNLEQCLLATCVGSLPELSDLVSSVVEKLSHHGITYFNNSTGRGISAPACGYSALANKNPHPSWNKHALECLFYYMRCSQLVEHASSSDPSSSGCNGGGHVISLSHERPYLILPPLIEWLRISHAHCEYRGANVADADDVMQAARLLLPALDYPPRFLSNDVGFNGSLPKHNLLENFTSLKLRRDVACQMLTSGQRDLTPQAVQLLGSQNIDACDKQGLTLLMVTALRGDEPTASYLLDAGADVNLVVQAQTASGGGGLTFDLVGWSALNFAVVKKHVTLARMLLNRGAGVELPEMVSDTPLQLAALIGDCDLINLLLTEGADPYYSTLKCDPGVKQRGSASAVVLAACRGHREAVQLLLFAKRRRRSDDVISLEDFLAEGSSGHQYNAGSVTPPGGHVGADDSSSSIIKRPNGNDSSVRRPNANDSSVRRPNGIDSPLGDSMYFSRLSKQKQKALLEALYHSAENGHLDVTMDLRSLGVPWNVHVWTQTLTTAHETKRKALVQLLLNDFVKHNLNELTVDFVEDCLPLLFDILKKSKNELIGSQVAEILHRLYGSDPVPRISIPDSSSMPRIDSRFVNNPEMSDVQFLVDNRPFYAHRIVLVNASEKFKQMLLFDERRQAKKEIEISDVSFEIFEMTMEFLYNGKFGKQITNLQQLLDLLKSAQKFELDHLRINCEYLLSQRLSLENCVEIYKFVKDSSACDLLTYCQGYFLQNLPSILANSSEFRKLLYHSSTSSSSITNNTDCCNHQLTGQTTNGSIDLFSGLLSTMTNRLESQLTVMVKKRIDNHH